MYVKNMGKEGFYEERVSAVNEKKDQSIFKTQRNREVFLFIRTWIR